MKVFTAEHHWMEKKKQPSVKAGSFGCGQVDKKEVLGWAYSHLTTSLNLEPDTKTLISQETCSKYNAKMQLASVLKSGLHFAPTFIFLTSKEKQTFAILPYYKHTYYTMNN